VQGGGAYGACLCMHVDARVSSGVAMQVTRAQYANVQGPCTVLQVCSEWFGIMREMDAAAAKAREQPHSWRVV